jgi:hypothetical protein
MKVDIDTLRRIANEMQARDEEHVPDGHNPTNEQMANTTGFDNIAEVADFANTESMSFPVPNDVATYRGCIAAAIMVGIQMGIEYMKKESDGKETTD